MDLGVSCKNIEKALKQLGLALSKVPDFTFEERMSIKTIYTVREIKQLKYVYPKLGNGEIEKVLFFCMNSGGIFHPLRLPASSILRIINDLKK